MLESTNIHSFNAVAVVVTCAASTCATVSKKADVIALVDSWAVVGEDEQSWKSGVGGSVACVYLTAMVLWAVAASIPGELGV